jgi:alpha-glucosidase
MAIAVTLLFAYPGVPCIYYGDEIGLEGGRDPDCRRCFDWDRAQWNAELHAHYRRLIAWRKARPEWRRGAYQTLAVGDDALLFARYTERSATLVAVNRGAQPVELAVAIDDLPLPTMRWHTADGAAFTGDAIAIPACGWTLVFGDPV